MRQFTKLLAALATLFLTVAFISCGDAKSSTNDEPQPVVFAVTLNQGESSATGYFTFKADGTYVNSWDMSDDAADYVESQGTYTGDPSTDGELILTKIKVANFSDFPNLKDFDGGDPTFTITISNGKFTVLGNEYSRQ